MQLRTTGVALAALAGAALGGAALLERPLAARSLPTGQSHRVVLPRGLAAAMPQDGVTAGRTAHSPFAGPARPVVAWSVDFGPNETARWGPLVGEDDTVYAMTFDRGLWAVGVDGASASRATVPLSAAPLGFATAGAIYVADRQSLRALSPGGEVTWTMPAPNATLVAGPLVEPDGSLTVLLSDGRIVRVVAPGRIVAEQRIAPLAFGHICRMTDGAYVVVTPEGNVHVAAAGHAVRTGRMSRGMMLAPIALPGGGAVVPTSSALVWVTAEAAVGREVSLASTPRSATLALDDRVVVALDSGELRAFDTRTGATLWALRLGGLARTSVLSDRSGTIYVPTDDGTLAAVGADGTLRWRAALGRRGFGSPALASDGTLYLLVPNGVVALRAP